MRRSLDSVWLRALLLAVAFFALAWLSEPFVFAPFQSAVVWLPSGLTIGVLVRARRDRWPVYLLAIFVAEVAKVIVGGDGALFALSLGVANVLRTVVGAGLMRRFLEPPLRLTRTRDVFGLVLFGAIAAPSVSATVGSGAVAVLMGTTSFWRDWVVWFLSDAMGALLVAPVVLAWRRGVLRTTSGARLAEAALLMVLVAVVADFLFGAAPGELQAALPYASFPLLIWAALRTGPVGASLAAIVLGSIALWHTMHGQGPFGAIPEPWTRILSVEAFLALVSASSLTLAASVWERKRLEQRERLLADVGELLAETLDLRQTLPRVARRVVPEVGGGFAAWVMQDEHGLQLVADQDVPSEALRRLSEQAVHMPEHLRSWVDPVQGSVLAPLRSRRRTLGVIAVLPRGTQAAPVAANPRLVEELARRCALAAENAALFDDAQRAIRTREDFLAIAAHELRTPITSLKLRLESAARRGEDTRSLLRQVRRLSRLVENLLDISRLTRGTLELERTSTDLGVLVQDVADRLSDDAARVGSSIQLHLDGHVQGDWDRLRLEQVVTNLLTNALKFGAGAPVELFVEQDGDRARLAVVDHGRGIDPEQRTRIFEQFAQGVSAREFGGLGLGLFLAREMVRAHGGRIWVDSEPGHGARFTVELPATPAAPVTPQRGREPSVPPLPPR